jgi:hypothetical protein
MGEKVRADKHTKKAVRLAAIEALRMVHPPASYFPQPTINCVAVKRPWLASMPRWVFYLGKWRNA